MPSSRKMSCLMTSADILFDATRIVLRLNVPCPHCGQTAGNPCRTSSGRYLGKVHAARDALALQGLRLAMDTARTTRSTGAHDQEVTR